MTDWADEAAVRALGIPAMVHEPCGLPHEDRAELGRCQAVSVAALLRSAYASGYDAGQKRVLRVLSMARPEPPPEEGS